MKKTKFCSLIIVLLLATNLFGQISLDSCQAKAKRNYPLINQYNLIEKSKEYSLSNAGKAYLPQLSITAIGGVIDGFPEIALPGQEQSSNDYNLISFIQLNQNIWDGGITSTKKDMIEAEAAIEQSDFEVKIYGLRDRINNLFFGILLFDEQIRQMDLLKDNFSRNLKLVETAVETGTAYKSDVDEIRVEILKTEQKISELEHNRSAYLKMLSLMIGESISISEKFEKPKTTNNFMSLAIKRPELSMFDNQRKLVEAQHNMTKTSLYPKIGLMGIGLFVYPGISFGSEEITRLLVGGLSLSWEIGGLYSNSNYNELSQIGLSQVAIQKETFLFNTNLELNQKQKEIEKIKVLLEKDQEILNLKTSIKNSYEIKYENGVSTLSQLLDRINDENVASLNLVLHEIQYFMASYKYKNISGN